MKIDIRDDHYKIICDILRKHLNFKDRVYAFGSRVKWTTKDSSDLDLAIDTDKDLHAIRDDFEDSDLPYFVDVIDYREIPDSMREEIDSHKLPLAFDVVKLGDVAEIIGGGTPSTKKNEYWDGDIPWLTPRDFSNSSKRFWTYGERSITELGFKNSSARKLPKGTILFTSRAPIGYIGIANCEVTTNQGFKSLIVNEKANNIYIYYLLKHITPKIKSIATGSTFQEVSGSAIKNIDVILPPLEEQERIADILSAFDDKIELNHSICKDLEHTAKLIFKKNFIEHEDREKWEIARLGDFFPIITGKQNVTITDDNGKYPFFSCSKKAFLCNQFSFDTSAILLAGNGDFNIKWYRGKFEAYQRTYVLVPHDEFYMFYLYLLIDSFLDDLVSGHRGSVINFITKGMIENFSFHLPNKELLDKYLPIINDLFEQIENLQNEIIHLTQTRDLLLPRLMRGE